MGPLTMVQPAPAGDAPAAVQRLWFGIAGERWKSLLLVPARGADARALAEAFEQVASASGERISVLDATGAALAELGGLRREIAVRGERVLVAVDPHEENPGAVALAPACDAAVLCIALGRTDLGSARAVLERVQARFLGAVVLGR